MGMNRLVLLVLLVALAEEPCQGNETNEGELENELVAREKDDSPSQWSRYVKRMYWNTSSHICTSIVEFILLYVPCLQTAGYSGSSQSGHIHPKPSTDHACISESSQVGQREQG